MNQIDKIKALLESPDVKSVGVTLKIIEDGEIEIDNWNSLEQARNVLPAVPELVEIVSFDANWHERPEIKEGDLVYIEGYGTQTIEKVMRSGYICEEGYLDWSDAKIVLLKSAVAS